MKNFKTNISLRDADDKRYNVRIECKDGKFSMMTENGQDYFNPADDNQKQLLDIWKEYHLNDLMPGTPEQMNLLKGKSLGYDEAKKYLIDFKLDGTELNRDERTRLYKAIQYIEGQKEIIDEIKSNLENAKYHNNYTFVKMKNLAMNREIITKLLSRYKIEIHKDSFAILGSHNNINKFNIDYPDDLYLSAYIVELDGLPYIYGTRWLTKELPENLEETIMGLKDKIESSHKEEEPLTEDNVPQDIYDDIAALGLHLGATLEDIKYYGYDKYDSNVIIAEGIEYMVLTKDETEEKLKDYINYLVDNIGFDGFNKELIVESTEVDKDGDIVICKKIIVPNNAEERGATFAYYDGVEHTIDYNGETYYIYKR